MYKFCAKSKAQPPACAYKLRPGSPFLLLLIIGLLQMSMTASAQRISLAFRNAPLKTVIDKIAEQTDFDFLVSTRVLKFSKPVTISVKDETLTNVLDQVFAQQPLKYEIQEKTVVISQKTANAAPSQERPGRSFPVTGQVTDSTGLALPGATVTINGSNRVTATDKEGRFSIQANSNDQLTISFIGYLRFVFQVPVPPADRTYVLHAAAASLNQVSIVSTGYQTIPKERATGSFVQIDSAVFNRRVSPDVLSRLEGVVPGLIFNRNTSAFSESKPDINIRGHSTLFSDDQPLLVVDNFPYDGDISNINPNDIASITVLKDAAAASIWGVRSGNGVIVITTKRGKANQPMRIEMNANVTVAGRPDIYYDPNYVSSSEFIDVEQALFKKGYYDNALVSTNQVVSPVVQLLADVRAGKVTEQAANTRINAYKAGDVRKDISNYFYRPSALQQYNLNFRGGGSRNDYFTSIGYDRNLPNLTRNSDQRITINSAHNFYPIKNLQISVALYLTKTSTANNNTLDDIDKIINKGKIYPYAQFADGNGGPLFIPHDLPLSFISSPANTKYLDWYYRPLDELKNADNTSRSLDNRINAGLSYSFFRGLKAELKYQYQQTDSEFDNLYNMETYYARQLINRFTQTGTSGVLSYPVPVGAILEQSRSGLNSHRIRGQLNYSRGWSGRHSLSALIGAEWSSAVTDARTAVPVYGYNDDTKAFYPTIDFVTNFPQTTLGSAQIPNKVRFSTRTDRFTSYFANAAYTYTGRYTLSGSARIDRSNLFGVNTNQRMVPLYSFGAMWNIAEEAFFDKTWLPMLKLRATYGFNGNINKSATAVTTLSQLSNSYYTGVPYNMIASAGNPDLKWEKFRVINLAIDFALKDQWLNGSLELYFKKGMDLYGQQSLAPSTGYTVFYGNTANTAGKGFDVMLNSKNIQGRELTWTTDLIYSYAIDKVTSYGVKQNPISYINGTASSITPIVGAPLFGIYSLKSGPLTHDTGDPQGYLNGQLSTNYASILSTLTADDLLFNGTARPKHFGSFRNNISWKGITFSANIVYKLDYAFRRSSINYGSLFDSWSGHSDFSDRWQQPGDELNTSVPSMPVPPLIPNRQTFYNQSQSLVSSGSHIRFQDINLSYDLTSHIGQKSPFASLSVYGYINNIGILWRSNKYGIDPDAYSSTGNTDLPLPRTYAIGIKSTFK